MGGVGDELALPLQVLHKGPGDPPGEEEQQQKYRKQADTGSQQGDAQHAARPLKLEEAVQHHDGGAAVRLGKDAVAVIAGVPGMLSSVQDIAHPFHHHLAIQGGNVLGIHLGDLPVFRQVDDEVSGLKGVSGVT